MTIESTAFLIVITGIVLSASADPNPACMKLPDVTALNGNHSCCEFPPLAELKVMDECWKGNSSKEGPEIVKICQPMECVFKRYNILKADATLDKVAAEKYLDTQLKGNGEWLKVLKPILLEQCLPTVDSEYDKMVQFFRTNKMDIPEASQCSMKPILVTICFAAKAFAKCPASSATKSPTCEEWKKYTNTCTEKIDDILLVYKLLDSMSSPL